MVRARRLLIERVQNMRELGGYAAEGGQCTQWGRFIRSNVPRGLTEGDIAFLRVYGVKTVIDLRSEPEIEWKPSSLMNAPGFEYHNIPFTDDFTYLAHPLYCPLDHLVPVMKGQHRVKEILTAMARGPGAVLFFCHAGKDRTGIIAALLLLIARVPAEDIMADYQVTYTYMRHTLAQLAEADVGASGPRPRLINDGGETEKIARPERLRRTEPEWLEPFLAYIFNFGRIDDYLAQIGLAEADLAALREKLLR